MNEKLDQVLEQLITRGVITSDTSVYQMKELLMAETGATEEQFQQYAIYCLQSVVEQSISKKKGPSVQ